MKKLLSIFCCGFILSSCSFKAKGDMGGGIATSKTVLKIDPSNNSDNNGSLDMDSDGDKVLDSIEIKTGSDSLVADVPSIESNFFQNFTMDVSYKKVNDNTPLRFTISTKIKDTDSSFKYRVGKLFGVENSMFYAAKEGRFSGHSYGLIKNEDFSWVKYPTLDPLMLHSDIIKYRPILDSYDPVTNSKFENHSVKITLDGTAKLAGIRFKEIKNLSVNFYYYDFEKATYVLLKNVLLERSFQRGVNEKFLVEIDNVPVNFLRESYLKHGEFLISEIDNYFIPEMETDYKTLISSVKSKTIPVLVTNPSEDVVYYVATQANGISFLDVLNRVFVKNFQVENNILKRVGQYESNLENYEHLIDVKGKDKLGKWFVLTNKFKEHFMDHFYLSSDHITLSYITGENLATQTAGIQSSYNSKVASATYNETVIPLGVVSPNSKVEIQLKGINRFGHEVQATPFSGTYHFGGGGNSTSLDYSCEWVGNKAIGFSRDFDLTINYNEEWDKMFLVINEERFKLSTLISEKKVIVRNLDFSFQVSIDDILKIKTIKQTDENNVSLVILSTLERKHQGLKLTSQSGNRNSPWCTASYPGALSTIILANSQYSGEISKGSLDASVIEREIVNTRMYPNNSGAANILSLKLMDDIDYELNYSLAISTRVINYFN